MTEKISPNHRQETFSKCTILLKSCRHRLLARRRRQTKPNRTEAHFLQCVPSCNIGVITLLGGIINQNSCFPDGFSQSWLTAAAQWTRKKHVSETTVLSHRKPPETSSVINPDEHHSTLQGYKTSQGCNNTNNTACFPGFTLQTITFMLHHVLETSQERPRSSSVDFIFCRNTLEVGAGLSRQIYNPCH